MEKNENESRENYLSLYVQKQEQMLLDYIRKSIDADIRATALKAALNDMTAKYEESQKQVEIQNDMMNKAAKGLEVTTLEKKHLEEKEIELVSKIKEMENNYNNRIKTIEEERHRTGNELQKINDEYNEFKKKNEEIFREFERQKEEMNSLFKENQEISKKLEKYEPKEKQVINKKDKKTAILPPDEF